MYEFIQQYHYLSIQCMSDIIYLVYMYLISILCIIYMVYIHSNNKMTATQVPCGKQSAKRGDPSDL